MSYQANVYAELKSNEYFRKVLFTGVKTQLVIMDIKPGEDIGEEIHEDVEQILFNFSGTGEVELDGKKASFNQGDVVIVSPGVKHNFINTGTEELKIYTIYSPANHSDGKINETKPAEEKKDETIKSTLLRWGHELVIL